MQCDNFFLFPFVTIACFRPIVIFLSFKTTQKSFNLLFLRAKGRNLFRKKAYDTKKRFANTSTNCLKLALFRAMLLYVYRNDRKTRWQIVEIYIFGAFEISISFLRILKLRAVSCVALSGRNVTHFTGNPHRETYYISLLNFVI